MTDQEKSPKWYELPADFWIGWAFGMLSVGAIFLSRAIASKIRAVRDIFPS